MDVVLKKIMEKHNLNKLQKYVEEDNELDKQMKVVQKNLNKYGKYIEELEKEVAILKKEVIQMRKNMNKNSKYTEKLEKEVAILRKDSHPAQEFICCRKCGCEIAKTKIKNK